MKPALRSVALGLALGLGACDPATVARDGGAPGQDRSWHDAAADAAGAGDRRVADAAVADTAAADTAATDTTAGDSDRQDRDPLDAGPRDLGATDRGAADHSGGDATAADAGWQPVACQASGGSCEAAHELPVPTHFSAVAQGHAFMAHDAPALFLAAGLPEGYQPGGCYPVYNYGLVPDVDAYPADTYTALAISDDEARTWAERLCGETGMPVRHLWPPGAPGGAGPSSRACVTQVVHAALAGDSLYTVILPPGWDAAAPAGTYPILFNGFYDLNENVLRQLGPLYLRLVAASARDGGRGVIGVLWNGGGAVASRTMSEHSLDLFAAIIAEVAARYRGNPQWIVTAGGSRGGVTALRMAANPGQRPYRVVASVAVVPPALIGDHARLGGLTYPALLHAMGWSTGWQDAWRWGWTYPACAGRPELTGLAGWQAHLWVLTGTADQAQANLEHSLLGPAYLDGLQRAGTQVYLGLGEHDNIVPYAHQVQLAQALATRVPSRVEVLVRGGHSDVSTRLGGVAAPYILSERVLEEVVAALADPGLDLAAAVPRFAALAAPRWRFHRVNRDSGEAEVLEPAAGWPFAVDLPYWAILGQTFPIVVVGEPGTVYALSFTHEGGEAGQLTGTIPASYTETLWIDLSQGQPAGVYTWSAHLRSPGGAEVDIPATATPTGDPCVTTVIADEPDLDYAAAMSAAAPPTLGAFPNTNWGLSQY